MQGELVMLQWLLLRAYLRSSCGLWLCSSRPDKGETLLESIAAEPDERDALHVCLSISMCLNLPQVRAKVAAPGVLRSASAGGSHVLTAPPNCSVYLAGSQENADPVVQHGHC